MYGATDAVNTNTGGAVCRETGRREKALLNPSQRLTMQCAIKANLTCVRIGSTASGDKTIFIKIHQGYLRLLIIAMCPRHCLNLICIKVPGSPTVNNGYGREQNQREPATCSDGLAFVFLISSLFLKRQKQWWHLNASDHRARGERPMVFYYNLPIQC